MRLVNFSPQKTATSPFHIETLSPTVTPESYCLLRIRKFAVIPSQFYIPANLHLFGLSRTSHSSSLLYAIIRYHCLFASVLHSKRHANARSISCGTFADFDHISTVTVSCRYLISAACLEIFPKYFCLQMSFDSFFQELITQSNFSVIHAATLITMFATVWRGVTSHSPGLAIQTCAYIKLLNTALEGSEAEIAFSRLVWTLTFPHGRFRHVSVMSSCFKLNSRNLLMACTWIGSKLQK